jgi:hypothetical protein
MLSKIKQNEFDWNIKKNILTTLYIIFKIRFPLRFKKNPQKSNKAFL